jgi:hypothetical protein
MGIFVHQLDDQVGPEARIRVAPRGQFDISQAVFSVPELGGDELLRQRVLRSARHRNIAAVGQRRQLERVFEAHLRGHVSRHHRNRLYLHFRRVERQQDG